MSQSTACLTRYLVTYLIPPRSGSNFENLHHPYRRWVQSNIMNDDDDPTKYSRPCRWVRS